MTDNPKKQAIAAIRSGDKKTARQLLMAYLADNPQDDQAWLILSAAVDSDLRRRECLETALAINPQNERAREQLQKLESAQAADRRPSPTTAPSTAPESFPRKESSTPTPASARATSPSSSRRLLAAIGISVLLIICMACFAVYAFTGWFGGDDDSRIAAEDVATRAQPAPTRSIPATNTPLRSDGQVAEPSIRCAAAGRYLEEIDDEVTDFANVVTLSRSAETDLDLLVYADDLGKKYEAFVTIPVPDCAAEGASELRLGMEANFLAVVEFAIGDIDHVEATERTREGGRQMLRGLNILNALAAEPLVPEPTLESSLTDAVPTLLMTSTPRPRPTTQTALAPEVLPIGSALAIDDGFSSWEVTVADIDYRPEMNLEIGGELVQQHIAEHRYVVLFLDAVNTGRQTDFFFPHPLAIRDGLGQEYEHDELATQVAVDFVYDLETLSNQAHPGGTARTIAVFDLPFGAGPFSLHYDWFSSIGETHPGVLLDIQD